MSSTRVPRVYAREFKLNVCRQWVAGDRSCAQLVREHGIAQSVLYRWRADYAQYGEDAFSGQPGTSGAEPGTSTSEAVLLQRIADLERALGKATLENQLLKKGRTLAASASGRS
jgi:transposase-like protein